MTGAGVSAFLVMDPPVPVEEWRRFTVEHVLLRSRFGPSGEGTETWASAHVELVFGTTKHPIQDGAAAGILLVAPMAAALELAGFVNAILQRWPGTLETVSPEVTEWLAHRPAPADPRAEYLAALRRAQGWT